MIMCLVILGVACTKTEIVEKNVYLEKEDKTGIENTCFKCDTLSRIKRTGSYPYYFNVGFCTYSDTAALELGIISGYFGYSYENDSAYFYETSGSLRTLESKFDWITDSTAVVSLFYDGQEYRGVFKRSL